jgi:hypothetical protein
VEKEYVVTLHKKEDLERFYDEMQLANFHLVMKRPLSRNTHYLMTEEQAEQLRQDSRVWGVEAVDSFEIALHTVNNTPYSVSGSFWKDNAPLSDTSLQWGHLHCAGNQTQRRKGTWGTGGTGSVSDTVEIFNNGKFVDVVIVDDPASYDSKEWYSPSTNQSRFVQYQWFNELNTIVSSMDDDSQTLPTGTITYGTNAATPEFHGIHVTGTACGQYYGWAKEANIYNLTVTSPWPSGQQVPVLLIFDYLRAFHLNKPINPTTGMRNPTITNHSYGGIINMPGSNLQFSDLTRVVYQGVTYNAANPPAGGWNQTNVTNLFGVRFGLAQYPAWSPSVSADVQDALEDGVVVIGAAGNANLFMAEVGDANWNNTITVAGVGTLLYNRGSFPNSPDSGSIIVGALNNDINFTRADYSNFGPAIDVFSPGTAILSAFGNTGLPDSKYGAGNYWFPISGTSMASPQVTGIAACLASGKPRFTNADILGFLNSASIYNDMTFDVNGGGFDDDTCSKGSPNKYLHIENPRRNVGYLTEVVGQRTSGMTFPRPNMYNVPVT